MLAMYAELVFTTFINADEFTELELPAPNDNSCKTKLSELEVINIFLLSRLIIIHNYVFCLVEW